MIIFANLRIGLFRMSSHTRIKRGRRIALPPWTFTRESLKSKRSIHKFYPLRKFLVGRAAKRGVL